MRRATYTLVLCLLAPLVWVWMWHRARRAGGYWGILSRARFGWADPRSPDPFATPPVWVHAVSLGETRAAQPLLQALLNRGLPVLLTHTTATGRAEGARLFPEAIASGQLRQTWLPYDFPGAARRFLMRYQPRCGLLIEREVWPNLLAQARAQGIHMALVSARFSASSLRQAKWMGRVLREALGGLDQVLAQTSEDAQRLGQAGARHVSVTGNLKFDLQLSSAQCDAGHVWRQALGRPVIAIASTREGEDALFVQEIKATLAHTHANAPLYLLIPRHPQRFDMVEQQLRTAGLTYVRRSQLHDVAAPLQDADTDVLLGDSLGEMAFYYAAADVVIVAGSFLPFGGQNLIEACAAGDPVIIGPHTFNFKQAANDAVKACAACRVPDVPQAIRTALALLHDESRRVTMSRAAKNWAAQHTGATERTLQALEVVFFRHKN
jgi:3-deoxy-D-manno-octulosonic-acid transferase